MTDIPDVEPLLQRAIELAENTAENRLDLPSPGIHATAMRIAEENPQLALWAELSAGHGEYRLRNALDVEAIGVIYFDMTGRIFDANNAFLISNRQSALSVPACWSNPSAWTN